MKTDLNCLDCGLCCFFTKQNAGRKAAGIEVGEDGWCIFYDKEGDKCSIYNIRPQTCKNFEIGGEICLKTRENFKTLKNKKQDIKQAENE